MDKIKIDYKIYYLGKNIFVAVVPNPFDLAMLFMRCQEFYESDSPKYRGKIFDIMEYIRWYAHNHENKFSYPQDWVGFNLPSSTLINCIGNQIPRNMNLYDDNMLDILRKIQDTVPGQKFCLLGISYVDELDYFRMKLSGGYSEISMRGTMIGHEVAHALFYLKPTYKKKALEVISEIPDDKLLKAKEYLSDLGYAEKVHLDEVQAYMISQMGETAENNPIHWRKGLRIAKSRFNELVDIFDQYNPLLEHGEIIKI